MPQELEKKVDKILSIVLSNRERLQNLEKNTVTKGEFKEKINKVLSIALSNQEKLQSMVTKEEFQKKTDKILTTMDGFAKKVENVETEQTSNIVAHDHFEKRITKLENVGAIV